LADSVLSRGISRHQYFLGKWHSRLVTVLGTFVLLGVSVLIASVFLLHEDLSPDGCAVALAVLAALLGLVVSCGVTVSATCNRTLLGLAFRWVWLYGGGLGLSLMPATVPSPDRALNMLPFVLRGYYDPQVLGSLIGYTALGSLVVATVGLAYFARRDI